MTSDQSTLTTTGHPKTLTQDELLGLLIERFGEAPDAWAFQCPACDDIATTADFRQALETNPRTRMDGTPLAVSDVLGRECIGRTLGVLRGPADEWSGRGCDWVAYGLFRGPVQVDIGGETTLWCFPVAPAPHDM